MHGKHLYDAGAVPMGGRQILDLAVGVSGGDCGGTGLTSMTTGILFLLAVILAPVAHIRN